MECVGGGVALSCGGAISLQSGSRAESLDADLLWHLKLSCGAMSGVVRSAMVTYVTSESVKLEVRSVALTAETAHSVAPW